MSFLYKDITGKSTDSGQYRVLFDGSTDLGIVIKHGNNWLAARPGSNTYEGTEFSNKTDAAKYLAELAGIDWQS